MSSRPRVGVLALQGDVREHLRMLAVAGAEPVPVRRPHELSDLDGIVIPGGESTTIAKLAETFGVFEPLRERITGGLPAYGSCAGMILLADRVVDGLPDQPTFGGLDVAVRRNAFGRQVDSFERPVEMAGVGTVHGVFIRAPWVEKAGADVVVLARVDAAGAPPGPGGTAPAGRIVAVRQGHLLATSFHPELSGDARVHRCFVDLVKELRRS